MNKKLMALAIAGAFVAPLAAQADTSNVTIYGVVSMSVDNVDGGGGSNAASDNRWRVTSDNSYIGFKGTEDLGNGNSAIWGFENALSFDASGTADTAASDTTQVQNKREYYLGMTSKSWGTVQAGNLDSPTKKSTGPLDAFKDTVADYRNVMGSVGGSVRAQNAIQYTSPDMSGFTAKVMTAAMNEGGQASGTSNQSFYSLSGAYSNGPIYAVLAYEKTKGITAAGTVSAVTPSGTNKGELKTTRAGFGYNFGQFKAGLGYERSRISSISAFTVGGTATAASDTGRNAWYLSGQYMMGSNTLKAAYTHGNSFDHTSNTGVKVWSLGADHAMSKRTKVYALYTKTINDSNINYAVAGGSTGIASVSASANGEDPHAWSFGMVHSF